MLGWSAWFIFAVIFFIIEIITPSVFFFACLGLGALVASAVSYWTTIWWLPWIAFVLFSIIFVSVTRPLARRYLSKTYRPANVDALVGKRGIVIEEINPQTAAGLIKVDGEKWKAEAKEVIPINNWVKILKVEGTHLEVEKE